MEYTTRAKLEKPEDGEFADQEVFNRNFDRVDSQLGAMWVSSTTRPANPFVGQKIWESDTGQGRMWNGLRWIWIGGLRPHGRLVHDNGLQQNLSDTSANATPVSVYSTDLEGGFKTAGTPGNATSDPLSLVVPEDGRYRVDMSLWQDAGATGGFITLQCVHAGVKGYDVVQTARPVVMSYHTRGSFTARFTAGSIVRLGVWKNGGDAAVGIYGTPGDPRCTALEMTYEGT